jgi:two-component system, LytTR family, sensor kinase
MTERLHFLDNQRLKVVFHVAVWIMLIFIYASIFSYVYSFSDSLLRALSNMLPMAALFYINLYLVDRFFEHSRYLVFSSSVLFLIVALAYLRIQLNGLLPPVTPAAILFKSGKAFWGGALMSNLLAVLLSTFYQVLEIRFRKESQQKAIINQQNEAQLQFLRAQINPHFLFNTLNNIYALAVARSEKTPQMVLRLSELLRYVVYETKENQILLTKEIAHLEQYLALFQLRNETPQNLIFTVNGNPEGLFIEPMMLIPLVENCCKHGDFEYNEHAFAQIELSVVDGWLHFSTRNSKNDQNYQKDQVGGVGLDNIRRRLALKYPQGHQFEISQTETEFVVHLSVQLAKQEK